MRPDVCQFIRKNGRSFVRKYMEDGELNPIRMSNVNSMKKFMTLSVDYALLFEPSGLDMSIEMEVWRRK
jgi:hypothetical protein